MVFYGGCWRTPEGIERKRAHMRIYNAARNQTMEGRSKRYGESVRRTWRIRAQRIADHDGITLDEVEARIAAFREALSRTAGGRPARLQ